MKPWLQHLDQLIRKGQGRLARRQLEARLNTRAEEPLGRPWLPEIAALCRRTGIPEMSVRLLCPLVRPKARAVLQATDLEKSEYAAGLIQIGADQEGRKLLETIDSRAAPRALFFGALARFARWDYEEAIPLLTEYVAHPALTSYERLVGELNLAAARVATDAKLDALEELIARTREEGLLLLHGNALEIQAQSAITRRRFDEARIALERAQAFMKEIGNTDALFVKKWNAVLRTKEDPSSASARAELLKVRLEAETMGHFETVRDCDFHLAGLSPPDPDRVAHLYFGTPFESYRRRILREFSFAPPSHHDWKIGNPARFRLNPRQREDLKPGQVLQRLLLVLSTDFYRPFRLASIHAQLFPDRHYNPLSSPAVIHQAVKRLRQWVREASIPLELDESAGSYRLAGALILRVEDSPSSADPKMARLEAWVRALEKKIPVDSGFTHADAVRLSEVPARTAHRFLSEALAAGKLEKHGAGKATCYRFVASGRISVSTER